VTLHQKNVPRGDFGMGSSQKYLNDKFIKSKTADERSDCQVMKVMRSSKKTTKNHFTHTHSQATQVFD
jgi:hypothetical protein